MKKLLLVVAIMLAGLSGCYVEPYGTRGDGYGKDRDHREDGDRHHDGDERDHGRERERGDHDRDD